MTIEQILAEEFNLKEEQVVKTVELIDEGNTIPFIARYRKEVTGSLDDTILRDLFDRLTYLRGIVKRREEVKNLIDAQGKLTEELVAAIDAAQTITEIDDIYRPYRPHRKTRASVARERGLEPLADLLFEQREEYEKSIEEIAAEYIDEEKGVYNEDGSLNLNPNSLQVVEKAYLEPVKVDIEIINMLEYGFNMYDKTNPLNCWNTLKSI